jgi:hypothetical protein
MHAERSSVRSLFVAQVPDVAGSTNSHETPGAFLGIPFENSRLHPLLCSQRHSHHTIDTVLQSLQKALRTSGPV